MWLRYIIKTIFNTFCDFITPFETNCWKIIVKTSRKKKNFKMTKYVLLILRFMSEWHKVGSSTNIDILNIVILMIMLLSFYTLFACTFSMRHPCTVWDAIHMEIVKHISTNCIETLYAMHGLYEIIFMWKSISH